MRLSYAVLAAALFAAGPLYAQTTSAAPDAAPATSAPANAAAPAAATPDSSAAPAAPTKHTTTAKRIMHPRMTAAQRFAAANTTHDGHLTKDQAKAGHLTSVYSHFDAIDKDNKGYVTEDDIKAYAAAHRSARHVTKAAAKPAATPASN